jgi:hypothetical protein
MPREQLFSYIKARTSVGIFVCEDFFPVFFSRFPPFGSVKEYLFFPELSIFCED